MSNNVHNTFIQAHIPKGKTGNSNKRIIMNITSRLVDVLISIAPEVYSGYVVYKNGQKVLYVIVLRAIYGILILAMLWYKKFQGDLKEQKCIFSPYYLCVANRIVRRKQHSIRFHVDGIMSNHKDKRVQHI